MADAAAEMDAIYRVQRHIYDASRKYYLLGRDGMLDALDLPPGGSVLEIGCGTGRNLILAADRYPSARFFGVDVSHAMLETAGASVARAGLAHCITLAQGDAARLDTQTVFGMRGFDRVFVSYALSMIPGWEQAVDAALGALAPSGSLHVVDFGQQERLPGWFAGALRAWLARFHVSPRAGLVAEIAARAEADGRPTAFTPLFHGYAWLVVVGPRSAPAARPG